MKKFKLATLAIATTSVLAALPISSAFAATSSANTTINANINSIISVSATPTVNITATPGVSDGVGTGNATVSVSTNNASGYNLSIKDLDSNTSLTSATASASISAHDGTALAPTALGVNKWGYRLAGFGADLYAGVTASDVQIKTTSTTANDDQTVVTFAVRVDATQKSATDYTDTVVFTAVTK